MNIRILVTVVAGTYWGVGAGAPGFFSPSDREIPDGVRKVATSIVQIVTLSDDPPEIPQENYQKFKGLIEESGGLLSRLCHKAIDECASKKATSCKIPFKMSATGFFIKDQPKTLWTAKHIYEDWLEEAFTRIAKLDISPRKKYAELLKKKVPFLLFDHNEKLLYDTRRKEDSASLSFVGEIRFINPNVVYPLSDVLSIELARSITSSMLTVAREVPKDGTRVYLGGFPTKTKLRKAMYKAKDAGETFNFSMGNVLELKPGLCGLHPQTTEGELAAMKTVLLCGDFDGVPGQSGGPIVNASGEYIALFTNHTSTAPNLRPEDDYSPLGGFGYLHQFVENLRRDLEN